MSPAFSHYSCISYCNVQSNCKSIQSQSCHCLLNTTPWNLAVNVDQLDSHVDSWCDTTDWECSRQPCLHTLFPPRVPSVAPANHTGAPWSGYMSLSPVGCGRSLFVHLWKSERYLSFWGFRSPALSVQQQGGVCVFSGAISDHRSVFLQPLKPSLESEQFYSCNSFWKKNNLLVFIYFFRFWLQARYPVKMQIVWRKKTPFKCLVAT